MKKDNKFPYFMAFNGDKLRLTRGDDDDAVYYRDGGDWCLDVKYQDGAIICVDSSYPFQKHYGVVLIPCTHKEWVDCNGHYAPDLKQKSFYSDVFDTMSVPETQQEKTLIGGVSRLLDIGVVQKTPLENNTNKFMYLLTR
jgi:hypothetical protein